MNVRMWAAKWLDFDKISIFLSSKEKTYTCNLDVGRKIAEQLIRDLTRTEQQGDETHEIVVSVTESPIVLERDDAIGLKHALINLLERGLIASPPVGYFKQELQLRKGSLVQLITMQNGRWV